MKMTHVEFPQKNIRGLKLRTNNKNEMNPDISKISPLVMKYFQEPRPEKEKNVAEDIVYCCYTEYEDDFNGEYTYFIGEESRDEKFSSLEIPAQRYAKFTTEPGPMPDVLQHAWQAIWEMSDETLGGKRTYLCDFEVYDSRASDHMNVVLDIYIGLEK